MESALLSRGDKSESLQLNGLYSTLEAGPNIRSSAKSALFAF